MPARRWPNHWLSALRLLQKLPWPQWMPLSPQWLARQALVLLQALPEQPPQRHQPV
jgi:hypothetical protein